VILLVSRFSNEKYSDWRDLDYEVKNIEKNSEDVAVVGYVEQKLKGYKYVEQLMENAL
jgi:hypothetical protein